MNKVIKLIGATRKARLKRDGNIKLGKTIATWSTLFSDAEWNIPELGITVSGTCGEHCKGCKGSCYVKKSYDRYTQKGTGRCSVKLGHAIRTILLRYYPEKVFSDLDSQIKKARNPIQIVRWNQSGEIENEIQFGILCRLAENNPDVKFFVYTKNYGVVVPALLAGKVPENLTVLISIWHMYGVAEYKKVAHLDNVKAFVYDDRTFKYEIVGIHIDTYCKAYDEKGHMDHNITCDICTKCFNRYKGHKVIGCYAH